jgi:hypothetical protein
MDCYNALVDHGLGMESLLACYVKKINALFQNFNCTFLYRFRFLRRPNLFRRFLLCHVVRGFASISTAVKHKSVFVINSNSAKGKPSYTCWICKRLYHLDLTNGRGLSMEDGKAGADVNQPAC